MLSITDYKYYQPERNGEMPEELFSFHAFRSEQECKDWLWQHDYDADEWEIHEYCNDEIEGVTIIDEYGDEYMKIEEVPDDGIANLICDEVLMCAGSMDNLRSCRQDDETEDAYKDRVYGEALDEVNAAIQSIEEDNEYNFAAYGGTPETEWYDEARDEAVKQVMRWMLGID